MFELTRNKKQGRLICGGLRAAPGYGCGAKSRQYEVRSPAAPELSICEQAKDDGWAYDIGPMSMMLGHTTLCPACLKAPQALLTVAEAAATDNPFLALCAAWDGEPSGRGARDDEPIVVYDEPGVDQRNPREDDEADQRNQFAEHSVRIATADDPIGGRFAREIIHAGGIKPWRKLRSPSWRRKGRGQRRSKRTSTRSPPDLSTFTPLTIFSTGLGRDSMTILAEAERGALKIDGWPMVGLEDLDAVVFSDPGHEWPLTYAAGVETAAVCAGRVPFYQLRKPSAPDTRHYAEVIYPAARKRVFAERKRRKSPGLEVSRVATSPWLHRKYRSIEEKARKGGYHVRLPLIQEYMLLGRSTTRQRAECTVSHKIEPVRALLNDLLLAKYGVTLKWWGEQVKAGRLEPHRMILGIAADEPKRVRPWEPEEGSIWAVRDVYPLVEAGITKERESEILAARGWGWVHKSGCMGCHYQSAAWFYMVRELHPAMFALLVQAEKRSEAVRGEKGKITAIGPQILGSRAEAKKVQRLRIKGPDRIDKEVADWAASTAVLKLAISGGILSEDFRRKLAKYDKGYTRIPNRKTPTWRQVAWITAAELANPRSRLPAAYRKAMRKQMFAEYLAKGYNQDCAYGKAGEKAK